MIQNVYIDGVQVNNDMTSLKSVSDVGAADIALDEYGRGGRSGRVLSTPFYRGFAISMEWFITARSYPDLITQRDRLARLFRLKPDKDTEQKRTLGFELANGVIKEIDVIFAPYRGNITPQDSTTSLLQINAKSEVEFFTSRTEKTATVGVYDGGGFGIPMGIPLDMSVSPSQQASVLNNEGNAEYYPLITISGELNAFDLTNETIDQTISYGVALESSDVLVLDMYNRTAVLNGSDNALANITGDWWYLDSGNNSIKLTTTGTPTGSALITYKDAYRGL